MKLLMVSPYPVGPTFGGVEAMADALVNALSKVPEVDELNVVSFLHGKNFQSSSPIMKGTHFQIYSQDKFELITSMKRDVNRLVALCDFYQPDIINAQGIGKEGVLAVHQSIPSIVTVHGLIHFERRLKHSPLTIINRIRYFMADRQIDMVLKKANLIISTSSYDKEKLSNKIYSPVISIANPVPLEFFNTYSRSGKNGILFVGVVQPRKNLEGIIRSFSIIHKIIPQALLRIVGPTPILEYVLKLKKLAKVLGVEENLIWLGHITQEELIAEYAKCSLLVMFSEEETSPMAVAQATAMGKPVVSSNVGGISDMILNGENGYLVPKEDESEFANRICMLLLDTNLCDRMGKSAKEYAKERCHPEIVARQTILAYKSLL
jgi:glycosyltransferase involved in cell wall biosynthesis